MMDSSVFLPGTGSAHDGGSLPRDSAKSISRKMVSVPLESVTDFPSPSTLTTAGMYATDAAAPAPENDFEISDMRKPNSMNVAKRHFLTHCSLLGTFSSAGGLERPARPGAIW